MGTAPKRYCVTDFGFKFCNVRFPFAGEYDIIKKTGLQ